MGNRLRFPITVLLPGQQLQFDEAMTKDLSQVLVADAVRRLTRKEELDLKPETLVAYALGSHLEIHRRWRQEGKKRGGSFWEISTQNLQVYRQ